MNAAEFAKRRARIEHEHGRRRGYIAKAMAALVRDAGAAIIIVHGKAVAWRLPNGQIVCRKRRYRTELDAMIALGHIRHDPKTPKIPTRFYLCPHCNGWHLSSQAPANDNNAQ
ncbi:hypothetical protein [Pseudomonas phage Persinger]|uniref:Uncharacterized protein n=1 Tax=Pseudomonas phage Persinger TaxID=2749430 RepID=A0A7D7ISZ3_9CAUD|nr:hypothetical protein KB682_gp23 [Pseudomonas phage Persinger]QMP19207.1 hypothetical protein [Pseudomonas phage Persinger]